MRRPVGATIEMSGERHRDKKGGRGAGRRCAGASLTDGVPPFAVKQPQTGTSRARGGTLARAPLLKPIVPVNQTRPARAGPPAKAGEGFSLGPQGRTILPYSLVARLHGAGCSTSGVKERV